MQEHITNIKQRATKVIGKLYPVIYKNNQIPLHNIHLTILKVYITPSPTYAGAAWAPYVTKSQWRQHESVQTTAIRTTTGMQTFLRYYDVLLKQTNTTTIKENIKKQSKKIVHTN